MEGQITKEEEQLAQHPLPILLINLCLCKWLFRQKMLWFLSKSIQFLSNSRQNREKWKKTPVWSSKCPESVAIVVIELHWVVFFRSWIILSVFDRSEKIGNNVAIFLRFSVAIFFRYVAVISDENHSLICALSHCECPNMVRFRAKKRGTEWKSRCWSRLISEKWPKIRAEMRVGNFCSSGGHLDPPPIFVCYAQFMKHSCVLLRVIGNHTQILLPIIQDCPQHL